MDKNLWPGSGGLAETADCMKNIIESVPRIEKYFPECFPAAIEAVCKFRFGVGDFGKIYGRHSFRYQRPSEKLRFKENGVELDIDFSCIPFQPADFCRKIEELYAVRVSQLDFESLEEFSDYCVKSIKMNTPVICDFSLGFIKGRREYGKVYTAHIVILYGYEPEASRYLALEQMLGTTTISGKDFQDNFEYFRSGSSKLSAYSLTAAGSKGRELERAEVLSEIEMNLENLRSESDDFGLRAINRLRNDLVEHFKTETYREKSFSIPGVWVFSHERHVLRNWLKATMHLTSPRIAGSFFQEFDALFARLFNGWLSFDFMMEKSLVTGNAKVLGKLPTYLDTLLQDESEAIPNWEKLRELIIS